MNVSKSTIKINQTGTTTQGFGQYFSDKIDFDGVGSYVKDKIYPYDIDLYFGSYFDKEVMSGDDVLFYVSPNKTIGVITSTVEIGDSIINVNSTVIDNIKLGFMVTINGEELGKCVEIGPSTITVDAEATAQHAYGSYFQISVLVANLIMNGNTNHVKVEVGINTLRIPAGETIRIVYNRNSAGTGSFIYNLSYQY